MTIRNTILVISDHPEQFNLAASRLREDGYRVRFEKSPHYSLCIAKAETPRLIITELAVPDIDGLELCLNIRNYETLVSTPILLVGDLSKESAIVSDGLRCGATDYLQKPFDDGALFEVCRKMASINEPSVTESVSENLFDTVVENLADAITIIDIRGIIHFASPSTKLVMRNDPNELIGKRMFDLVHPADLREVEEYFDSIQWDLCAAEPIVYRVRQDSGSWKLIESIGRPIDDSRFGSAVLVTSRETSASKVSLAAAMENDMLRQAFFIRSPLGLATFSTSGHFVEANPALLAKLSNSRDELYNMSLSELIFPADDYFDRQAIGEIFSGKRSSYEFDNGYLDPSGERVWGRVALVMCSGHDSDFLIGVFNNPDAVETIIGLTDVDSSVSTSPSMSTVLNFCDWKINKGLMSDN